MHPDAHLVRARPPILDVPPLVWIDPPGAPKVAVPSGPLWEWPAPQPRRRWRAPAPPQIALAIIAAMTLFAVTFAVVVASAPAPPPQMRAAPVPRQPVWCACIWWPSGPARSA